VHFLGKKHILSKLCIDFAKDWTTVKSWFDSHQGQERFGFSRASKPAFGPSQLPLQWLQGPFLGSKAAAA
jgi:hypothetical protein